MATTLEALRIELARQTDSLVFTGTADGASVEHIRDSLLTSRHRDPTELVGHYLLITSGARDGDKRIIDIYGPDEGALYVDNDFAADPSTATYEIHKYDPEELNRCINHALTHRWYKSPVLLTRITDGDMETSGVTNWTDVTATSTKVTTVWRGAQALRVANSSANGYSRPAAVDVLNTQTYFVAAFAYNAVGTAKLQVTDTSGTEIKSVSSDMRDWKLMAMTFDSASNDQVHVRLLGSEATADIYWDDLVFTGIRDATFFLPSTVVEEIQLNGVWGYEGFQSLESQVYAARPLIPTLVGANPTVNFDPTATTPVILNLGRAYGSRTPLWVNTYRKFAELSTDASTTTAEQEWVIAWAAVELFTRLIDGAVHDADINRYQNLLAQWVSKAATYERSYRPRNKTVRPRIF